MIRTPNNVLIRDTLNHLQQLYMDTSRHEGIHLTDLIYCLTRSYWDKVDPLPPTDEEVLLFALGWGLQKVLVPRSQDAEVLEVDGIYLSPDFISLGGVMAELKTTRQSSRRKVRIETFGNEKVGNVYEPSPFSETWVEQMMGYTYAKTRKEAEIHANWLPIYDLLVLHMMGNYAPPFPQLVGWRVEFTPKELKEFWDGTLFRKKILSTALENHHEPVHHIWNKDWECENCRYKIRCNGGRA